MGISAQVEQSSVPFLSGLRDCDFLEIVQLEMFYHMRLFRICRHQGFAGFQNV